jgi:hypothetical protein
MRGAIPPSQSSWRFVRLSRNKYLLFRIDMKGLNKMYVKIMVFRDVLDQTAGHYISVESSNPEDGGTR